jgi:hypothetical protein
VNANYVIQQIRMFLRSGSPADAEVAWTINARDLEPFDRLLTKSWIDHGLGYAPLANMEFSSLIDQPQNEQTLDKLVTTLIMHPDADAFRDLHRRMLVDQESITLRAAGDMWIAAVVCQSVKERDFWALICAERFRMNYPPISTIRFEARHKEQKDTVPFLVNSGVFSRETITALYWKTRQDGGTNNTTGPTLKGTINTFTTSSWQVTKWREFSTATDRAIYAEKLNF